jgi:DNA-binding transcriptional MerR regulator
VTELLPALPDKDFFTMGEIERIAQVPAHTLRYWEKRVGLLKPARRSSGHRRYTREDLETILKLKDLLQRRRLTIAGARRALLELKRGPRPTEDAPAAAPGGPANAVAPQTLKLLREIRKEIQALVDELK